MTNNGSQALVVVGSESGITLIEPKTPLTRLNYFDGKFLRAADLDIEQKYLRRLVAVSNQGLGGGVVYGFDTVLATGDQLQIGPGLAIDAAGEVLLMAQTATLGIQDLIDASRKQPVTTPTVSRAGLTAFSDCAAVTAPPSATPLAGSDLFVIAICPAEALCGEEAVYGKLCEEACITTSNRPYRLEGVIVRAIPLQLVTPFPTSKAVSLESSAYLRSKVAHSYYADEAQKHPHAIRRDGLLSGTWCLGAGYEIGGCEVPLAVLARAGSTTLFLDAWIVRRERMTAPGRRYWEWKMMMRPWDVFVAQVLQFQCQLASILSGVPILRAVDPCASAHGVLGETIKFLDQASGGVAQPVDVASARGTAATALPPGITHLQISDLKAKIQGVLRGALTPSQARNRILIRGGIIELPSAGYLPVLPDAPLSVNEQVRALLGEGLDLRFCIVRADYVAHALEEAQHMERVSLVQGLDDPATKPKVDVLVPDGVFAAGQVTPAAQLFDAVLKGSTTQTGGLLYKGTAREEPLRGGGTALYAAAVGPSEKFVTNFAAMVRPLATAAAPAGAPARMSFTANLATNPFVRTDPTAAAGFDTALGNATVAARAFTMAAAAPVRAAAPPVAAPMMAAAIAVAPGGSVDGLWLTSRADESIRELALYQQTHVSARVIAARFENLPLAVEGTFHGVLTVVDIDPASAGGDLVVKGALDITATLSILEAVPAQEEELEITLTRKVNLNVTLTYSGTDLDGTITLDVFDPNHPDPANPSRPIVRVTKAYHRTAATIVYELLLTSNSQDTPPQTVYTPVADLTLTGDVTVGRSDNPYHRFAEQGLDLVQAALSEIEPTFKQSAELRLFPDLPAATLEPIITAQRDWVLFHRRRDKQCTLEVVPVVTLPRSYRVFNITAASGDDAKNQLTALADPATLAAKVRDLATSQPDLVVSFAGGSAQPLFDFAAVDADWKSYTPLPGNVIAGIIFGSKEDDDPGLQTARVRQLETAIVADSKEDGSTVLTPVVPFPLPAVPADADGIMLFVTVAAQPGCQHVFGVLGADVLKRLTAVIVAPGVTAALIQGECTNFKRQQQLFDLGKPRFTIQGDPIDATQLPNVAAQWNASPLGAGQVGDLVTWIPQSDPDMARHLAEASAIEAAIVPAGQPRPTARSLTGPVAPADVPLDEPAGAPPCPVVTLVLAVPRDLKVRMIYAKKVVLASGIVRAEISPGAPEPVITFAPDGSVKAGLTTSDITAMAAEAQLVTIQNVELGTSSAGTAAQQRADVILQAIRNAQPAGAPPWISPNATASVTALSSTEASAFLNKGGVSVQEIAFLLVP